jgi:hypothetical protein
VIQWGTFEMPVFTGDDNNNNLSGGVDNDTLIGAGGDDYISGQQGDDSIDGGAGRDIAAFFLPPGTPGGFRMSRRCSASSRLAAASSW